MTYAIIITLIIFSLSVSLVVVSKRLLDLNERFEELGIQVEESLDILNDCYASFSRAAETPLLSNEPTVIQLVNDIRKAKHAMLLIANKIVTFDDEEEDQE